MVAVDDCVLLEIHDAVFRDEAEKIAPLLFNPKLSTEQNRSEGRWIQQHNSFDVGYIWDRRYLSLLHVASMAAAEKCIKLLIDPPYSWNPDILDGDGNCPMHYLVRANVPSVFYLLWKRSRKSYQPDHYLGRSFYWLIWPHTAITQHAGLISEIGSARSMNKAIFRWQKSQEQNLECRVPFGLLLELCVSWETNCSWDFWTASWPLDTPRWFWPIPRPKPQSIPYHDEQCTEYPGCLDQLLTNISNEIHTLTPYEPIYRLLVSVWAFHTLTEQLKEGSITYRVPRPPTLKRICRFQVRKTLVKLYDLMPCDQQTTKNSNHSIQNYFKLVESLPMGDELKDFLMYSDLWPTRVDIHKPKTELVEARANSYGDLTFDGEEPFGFLI